MPNSSAASALTPLLKRLFRLLFGRDVSFFRKKKSSIKRAEEIFQCIPELEEPKKTHPKFGFMVRRHGYSSETKTCWQASTCVRWCV